MNTIITRLFHSSLEHGFFGITNDRRVLYINDHYIVSDSVKEITDKMIKHNFELLPLDSLIRGDVLRSLAS